tara:strand:- start:368 stop:820 length:453 start_codon:yes stop_codon:yes gene_type:complete
MFARNIFIIFVFLFFSNCGFEPIYSVNNERLNIEIKSYEGDNITNLKILSKLRTHKNNNSKLFIIKFITDYEKKDLTKDTSGKVQNYQLNFSTKFIVVSDGKEREFIFNEKFIMKNFEDDFEGRNYENDIKENIANLIYQKLMIQLARIE